MNSLFLGLRWAAAGFAGSRMSRCAVSLLILACSATLGHATGQLPNTPDVATLQNLISSQRAPEALRILSEAVERNPENPRLSYNLGVAAYAAGKFEEALLAFDRVESLSKSDLLRRSRFQKGNCEFEVGVAAQSLNLDDTIARWKESLRDYDLVLQEKEDPMVRTNRTFVEQALLKMLLLAGRTNMAAAQNLNQPPLQRIDQLRNAFAKYSDAREVDPKNEEAKHGESASRDQLAEALAAEGSKKSQNARYVMPGPREAPIPHPDFKDLEEGVSMVEDAHQLKPESKPIEQALDAAKQRMARAMAEHARNMLNLEPRIPQPREKLAVLRMAKEFAEKALDKVPNHPLARQTLDEINKRLAEVMEDQGDELTQQSDAADLEQQTQMLSQSLDFYQQAGELRPQEQRLQTKAKDTQQKLEKSLDKLADQLMKSPGSKESLEAKAARLEGAEQALNELQSLAPSNKTAEKAEQVGNELDGVRQQLADQAKQSGGQTGGDQPQPTQPTLSQNGLPLDAPPKVNTPGVKGKWNSTVMNKAQDY
jgi:tetratricopeptide (TPR) repeat protein